MTTNRPLRVFLCHSSNDKPAVRELYQKLRAETWIQPWLDEEEPYLGQDWNMEIEKKETNFHTLSHKHKVGTANFKANPRSSRY